MDLIRRIGKLPIGSEACRAGYLWLAWNVIASLLPLWGTAFLLMIFGKDISMYGFLKNGEFVLYAAAFAGGAMYVIRRDIFPSKNSLTLLFVLMILISLLVFVAITVLSVSNNPAWLSVSEDAITSISIVVIVATTILSFFVTVADASGAWTDVPQALKNNEQQLEEAFDQLLNKSGR